MESVAEIFLNAAGYTPYFTGSEHEAKSELSKLKANKQWPVLTTPLDTAGEKPYEEFVAEGESTIDIGYNSVECVGHIEPENLNHLLSRLKELVDEAKNTVTVDIIANLISAYLPSFSHKSSEKKLDDRM